MRYVYAALLLHASGTKIEEETLTNVLTATGTDVDPARVKALVASLSEVNIDDAIKMAPRLVPTTPAVSPEAEPKKEDAPVEEEEEEEEEKKEEEALAGLGALFG
jgi:large subunit ribosomal protein L12